MLKLLNDIFPSDLANIIHNYTLFGGISTKSNINYLGEIVSRLHQQPYSNYNIIQILEYENKVLIADKYGIISIFENDELIDILYDYTSEIYNIYILSNGDIVVCSRKIHDSHPSVKLWRHKDKMSKYDSFKHVLNNPLKYYQKYNDNDNDNYRCLNTIIINTIYPQNILLEIKNNYIVVCQWKNNDDMHKYINVYKNNKLKYTLYSETSLFTALIMLENNNVVTGSNLGVVKIWKENKNITTLDNITKRKIIKFRELLNGDLIILDKQGYIYIWGENRIIAILEYEIYDIVILPNNDFITITWNRFMIWRKKLNNITGIFKYTCILGREHDGKISIKAFEHGFISWKNSDINRTVSIWIQNKDEYYKEEPIKNIKKDIFDIFVLPNNRLAAVNIDNDINILS